MTDWVIRAIKTFAQAFFGVLVPEVCIGGFPADLPTAWAYFAPVVAAAIAAVWKIFTGTAQDQAGVTEDDRMSTEIVVGLMPMAGTIIGSLVGLLAANKLVMYRIEQLEKKVEKHNQVVERVAVMDRDVKTAFTRIDELRDELHRV